MKLANCKANIRSTLKKYFSGQEEVVFSYLFGSFVNGDDYRDVDLGIYTEQVELLGLGTMHSEISDLINCEFDLIFLNDIPRKNPVLAYEVVTKGELLTNREPKIHTRYKREALLFYFDTAYLRNKVDNAFKKRLKENKFGSRNYE